MKWLLIASLICLPMATGCASGGGKADTEEAMTTDDAAMKYECKTCGTKAAEPGNCPSCGKECTPIE